MADLGLSSLTDDQIVELARQIAAEAAVRSPAVTDAAKMAVRGEIDRATNDQARLWSLKKWIAEMVRDHLNGDCTLTVLTSGNVRRVSILCRGEDRKSREDHTWTYHATGDDRQPPGALTLSLGSRLRSVSNDRDLVAIICRHALAAFPAGVEIWCDQAASTTYSVDPFPADYAARAAYVAEIAAHLRMREEFYRAAHAAAHTTYNLSIDEFCSAHDIANRHLIPKNLQSKYDSETGPLLKTAIAERDATMAAWDRDNPAPTPTHGTP